MHRQVLLSIRRQLPVLFVEKRRAREYEIYVVQSPRASCCRVVLTRRRKGHADEAVEKVCRAADSLRLLLRAEIDGTTNVKMGPDERRPDDDFVPVSHRCQSRTTSVCWRITFASSSRPHPGENYRQSRESAVPAAAETTAASLNLLLLQFPVPECHHHICLCSSSCARRDPVSAATLYA